jgi:hypothetical protein
MRLVTSVRKRLFLRLKGSVFCLSKLAKSCVLEILKKKQIVFASHFFLFFFSYSKWRLKKWVVLTTISIHITSILKQGNLTYVSPFLSVGLCFFSTQFVSFCIIVITICDQEFWSSFQNFKKRKESVVQYFYLTGFHSFVINVVNMLII